MAKVYIEEISRSQRTSRAGKPFISVGIKSNGRWINGFGGKWNEGWQQGDSVEIEVEQKGEYLNFKQADPAKARLDQLEARIAVLENMLVPKKAQPVQRSIPRQPAPGSAYPSYDERNPPPPTDNDYTGFPEDPF